MKSTIYALLFAACASTGAHAYNIGNIYEDPDVSAYDPTGATFYPEGTAADLKLIATLINNDPQNYGEQGGAEYAAKPWGNDSRKADPFISVRDVANVRSGLLTEPVSEYTRAGNPYGENMLCTYPKGGFSVQYDATDPGNFMVTGTVIGMPYHCESTSWTRDSGELGHASWRPRVDSLAAIGAHWRALNDYAIDATGRAVQATGDAISRSPLLSVPLFAVLIWLARRYLKRRKASQDASKPQQ